MASGSRKRQRESTLSSLQELVHCGGISRIGLVELVGKLRSLNIDLGVVKLESLRTAEGSLFRELCLSVEVEKNGGSFTWEYIDPNKLLVRAVADNSVYGALFADAVARSPPSLERPWRLVIGFDEYTPGLYWELMLAYMVTEN